MTLISLLYNSLALAEVAPVGEKKIVNTLIQKFNTGEIERNKTCLDEYLIYQDQLFGTGVATQIEKDCWQRTFVSEITCLG